MTLVALYFYQQFKKDPKEMQKQFWRALSFPDASDKEDEEEPAELPEDEEKLLALSPIERDRRSDKDERKSPAAK
jgi:hypothetical protein